MISGIASPPPPPKVIDFTSPPAVKASPRLEEAKPLLKIVRKQSPSPLPVNLIQRPPIKKPPMIVPEEIKKPEPPKKIPSPKKKEPEPSDDDEYFDEEAEKEKDRLRRLRNMNRRAHRGFS